MGEITNSELTQEIREVAGIQAGKDKIPTELDNKVLSVIDVNPKHARKVGIIKTNYRNATGTASIFTTQSGADFYMTGILISMTNDAAADNTYYTVTCVINGETLNLFQIRKQTLTAFTDIKYLPFETPIKVDRNTVISHGSVFTVGTVVMQTTVFGYYVYNANA